MLLQEVNQTQFFCKCLNRVLNFELGPFRRSAMACDEESGGKELLYKPLIQYIPSGVVI